MAPDQATFQRSAVEEERSSRARTGGRDGEEEWRVWIRDRGRETKQLSMPPTNRTSNSMAGKNQRDGVELRFGKKIKSQA